MTSGSFLPMDSPPLWLNRSRKDVTIRGESMLFVSLVFVLDAKAELRAKRILRKLAWKTDV